MFYLRRPSTRYDNHRNMLRRMYDNDILYIHTYKISAAGAGAAAAAVRLKKKEKTNVEKK